MEVFAEEIWTKQEKMVAKILWDAYAEIIHKQGFVNEMKSPWPPRALDCQERYLFMARKVIET
jgi:hypothetical protein